MKRIILLLICLSSVLAASPISENTGDVPVDFWAGLCDGTHGIVATTALNLVCGSYNLVTSTSNFLSQTDADAMVNGANTVHDMEINLLKEEIALSEQRISQDWNNVLTILYLLVEVIKIIYYSILILLVLFVPYIYIKLINFIRGLLFKWNKKTA